MYILYILNVLINSSLLLTAHSHRQVSRVVLNLNLRIRIFIASKVQFHDFEQGVCFRIPLITVSLSVNVQPSIDTAELFLRLCV